MGRWVENLWAEWYASVIENFHQKVFPEYTTVNFYMRTVLILSADLCYICISVSFAFIRVTVHFPFSVFLYEYS